MLFTTLFYSNGLLRFFVLQGSGIDTLSGKFDKMGNGAPFHWAVSDWKNGK